MDFFAQKNSWSWIQIFWLAGAENKSTGSASLPLSTGMPNKEYRYLYYAFEQFFLDSDSWIILIWFQMHTGTLTFTAE
jgi:hypothetical protein